MLLSWEEEGSGFFPGISACLVVFGVFFSFLFSSASHSSLLIMLGASQGLDNNERLGESSSGTSLPFPFMVLLLQCSCVQLRFCTTLCIQPARDPDAFPAGLPRSCAVVVRKLGLMCVVV